MRQNIFITLAKYASQQEENFLTEAFVYLLDVMLEKDSSSGISILKEISGAKSHNWFSEKQTISITTQITIEKDRPDIAITIGNEKIIFIEVKHDSKLGEKQLERYYSHLENSHYTAKQLVLLTRSRNSIQETNLDKTKFHHICWYEISSWLSEIESKNKTVTYLIQQFIGFLKDKEMSMEKITWEYIRGLPAMKNFLDMLGAAISEANPELTTKKTIGWTWGGYYLEGNIFLGLRFTDHLLLSFENDTGNKPTFIKSLHLEENHFFSLSAGEQLELLVTFIQESYTAYNNL
ncbi:MAG: PD-(D/E)XK nuclease family protein [Chloroflexi bacterium]|nr:PD-(D/E)XK nuclease family protein [Chloroflexota bacterium]